MPRGQEKFLCIADMQGWGYSNCDIRAYLAAIDILQVWKDLRYWNLYHLLLFLLNTPTPIPLL